MEGPSGIMGAFSAVDEDVVFEAASPSFDLLGGVKSLPSAFWWAKTGEEAWPLPLLRCLFDGMPRADARLLAIEELMSRGARWAAGRLCDAGRYGETSCAGVGAGDEGCCGGAGFESGAVSGFEVTGWELRNFSS